MYKELHGGNNMNKKVLIMTSYYIPSIKGGGPIQSIKNIVDYLSDEIEFYIVTSDRDLGDKVPFKNIETEKWNRIGNAKVFYIKASKLTFKKISDIVKSYDFDMIYLNSFFSYRYSIVPILLKKLNRISDLPIIIAPRGEFSPGALQLKPIRKKIYINISKILGLYKNIVWHGTTDTEGAHIQKIFKNAEIKVANNLTKDYSGLNYNKKIKKKKGKLRVTFISRIHPKKNLLKALQFLEKVDGKVEFNIFGPIEDNNYWLECKNEIQSLPQNIKVEYRGVLSHQQVQKVFMSHHVFLFPTLGENFGHVISEALVGGCPVIISDQTPWIQLEKKGVGRDIPLEKENEFIKTLNYYLNLNQNEYDDISKRAFFYGKEKSKNLNDKKNTKKIFNV